MVMPRLQAMDLMGLEEETGAAEMKVPRLVDLPGVADMHGDVPVDRRHQRAGMEHLGPEVGQLGRFREGDGPNLVDARNDPGVRGEDARNVGPDLDIFGLQRGSDQ